VELGRHGQALKDTEKAYLEKAIKALQEQIDNYGKAAPSSNNAKFHGMALLGLGAFGASCLAPRAARRILVGAFFVVARSWRAAISRRRPPPPAGKHRPSPTCRPATAASSWPPRAWPTRWPEAPSVGFHRLGRHGFRRVQALRGRGLRDVDWKTSAKQASVCQKYDSRRTCLLLRWI